jgi:CHAT domain-containing protein
VTLAGLGLLYTRLHERQRGLDFYIQALALVQATNSSLLEANILYLMMKNLQSDQPSAAIFWGKNAVNLVQQARASFEGLDRELESAFLTSKEDYYRTLATLLIDQGRLPEAIWILDALKQQEYADYSRGNLAKSTLPVPLTPEEKRAADDYRRLTQEAVVKNRRWKELDQKGRNCTPDEKKELQDLTAELETFGKQFDKALDRVYKDLGGDASANFKIEVVKSRIGEMEKQITTPNTVGIYTLVTADRYIAIFVSDGGEVEREHAITTVDLNNKVATLQKLLSDPSSDPRPTEIDLYNIIIGPIKDDLELANAKSLIWSLDGVLRYIPLGALFDGSQYMIEQYSLGMLTSKSYSHLDDQPRNPNMAVAGMGISLKYEDDLNPLPAVVKELHEIIHDPEVEGANGVLPGSILLNGQFTKKAMEDRLGERPAIVHIASHFVLQPGDNSASYLLLAGNDSGGGGFHLTVEDFSNDRSMSMAKTELLTLSACQTAIGSNAKDGLEIDGLAMAAEQKGARSVIASMWEVDDESTGVLMADFYKRWAGGEDRVMKIEALRQAQLDLLKGRIAPSYNSADPNAPTNYAHPYYWAPFVLMGNWR